MHPPKKSHFIKNADLVKSHDPVFAKSSALKIM
jgi:hypothetical protein